MAKKKRTSVLKVKDDFQTLDNLSKINRYFKLVAKMDKANIKSKMPPVKNIMEMWSKEGVLEITGDKKFGKHSFKGQKELSAFYEKRARGIPDTFRRMVLNMAGAKSVARNEGRAVANGVRHLLTRDGQGLAVPFSHDFSFDDNGLITSLHINIGKPNESPIAPQGNLDIKDMGKLAAVAWMVA
jgi:hypothetical protein